MLIQRKTFKDALRTATAAAILVVPTVSVSFAATEISEKNLPIQFATPDAYSTATGHKAGDYKEAPMLAARVADGSLPPVSERLPLNPVVLEPLDTIGQYGGVLSGPAIQPNSRGWDILEMRLQSMMTYDDDYLTPIPNIAESVVANEDATEYTVTLREGMKWSDGVPLTTEDVAFFYEHILTNEVVTAAPLSGWKAGGELVKLEVIDDYTFKWIFAVPNPSFTLTLASERLYTGLRPKHYLAQFHGDLNLDADKLAEEAGQSTWAQLFALKIQPYDRTPWADADLDPDQPTLETYVYKSTDAAGNKMFERNPYFFKVDIAGNQLPYTDGLNRILVQNLEVQDLKGISGDYTHYGWGTLSNFTTYKENEASGDYNTRLLTYLRGNETGLAFNVNHPDPVKREVYGDLRFRKAMSLAINRQEINDLVYFGKATPRQASPTPIESYFSEDLSNYYADFDAAEAGRLLDEMGLDKRDADGFRIGPDGETFIINMEQGAPEPAWVKTLELVTQHWNAIGVRTELKMIQVPLFQEKRAAGQLDVPAWAYDGGETSIWAGSTTQFVLPPYGYGATQWDNWLRSDGANGEEPPQSVKDHVATYDAFRKVTPDTEEYSKLGSELMRYAVENLYVIGTVGLPPQPLLIDNRLQNGPREGEYWSWSYRQWVKFHPEQFWLQDN